MSTEPVRIEAPALVVAPEPVGHRILKPGETIAPTAREADDTRRSDERDRVSHGQRRINLLWEMSQSAIAILVTVATLAVAAGLLAGGSESGSALLSNAFFLVIGFYFGRTNHTRVGGAGARDPDQMR